MPSPKNRPLVRAAAQGDLSTLERLLADGADVNEYADGKTALHAAVQASRTSSRDDVLDALLAAGADIEALDDDDCTPLMVACNLGKVRGSRMALRLIALGASVKYVRKADGSTALRMAVARSSPAVLAALVERGAPVNGPKGGMITPLMCAAMNNNLETSRALVELGADLSIKCKLPWAKGKTAEEMAMQEKRPKVAALLRKCREKSK